MKLNFQVLTAALALAACQPKAEEAAIPPPAPDAAPVEPAPTGPSPIPMSDTAGPSGQDSMTWFADSQGRNSVSRLMYSARTNDEMGLNLQCREPGVVTALIIRQHHGPQPEAWPFTLVSGDAQEVFDGKVADTSDESLFIEATKPASSPVFASLRATGKMTVKDSQGEKIYDAIDDAERQAIASFFDGC